MPECYENVAIKMTEVLFIYDRISTTFNQKKNVFSKFKILELYGAEKKIDSKCQLFVLHVSVVGLYEWNIYTKNM